MNSKDMARQLDLMLEHEVRKYENDYGNVYSIEYTGNHYYILKDVQKNGTSDFMVFFDEVDARIGYLALFRCEIMVGGIMTDDLEVKDTL